MRVQYHLRGKLRPGHGTLRRLLKEIAEPSGQIPASGTLAFNRGSNNVLWTYHLNGGLPSRLN